MGSDWLIDSSIGKLIICEIEALIDPAYPQASPGTQFTRSSRAWYRSWAVAVLMWGESMAKFSGRGSISTLVAR